MFVHASTVGVTCRRWNQTCRRTWLDIILSRSCCVQNAVSNHTRALHHFSMWCSLAGRLWIHAAAKVPDPDEITALEEFYRQLYETAGITAEFPQHYPTSALLGCVDCVNIVSNEEFRLMRGIHPSVRCRCRCLFIPIVNEVLLQVFAESESPYVFCCENPKVKRLCALWHWVLWRGVCFQRLIWPIRMSGQHKLWSLPHDVLASAKRGLTDVKAPMPVTFPR